MPPTSERCPYRTAAGPVDRSPGRASPTGDIEPAVVSSAGHGDRAALRQVFGAVHPMVLAYCRARLGRSTGADAPEDVAQTVCLNLLAALPRYRDTGRPYLAYVYTCAANAVTDAHRRAARRPADPVAVSPEVTDPTPGPEARGVHVDVAGSARQLLDTLPERMREVLVLRVALGLSARRTGELLSLTEGTVRVIQHRALARLRTAAA